MADKIFNSTAVTFVDMTDARTLDVYIASNHPTAQLYDSNKTTSKYTPDWSVTNLELEASFYLDSQSITPASIKWYTKIGATKNELISFQNKDKLLIATNSLSSNPIITYICEATYDTITAYKEITFTRVDIGKNGENGTDASLVDITPSANFFKSTTGKDGVFTPDYIYLYPRFQTVTYGKWQYYNSTTNVWVDITSGSNGLTIGTYNSIANSLQIAKSSSLYTDSITSVSFRCVSSNASVYDTVSIAKIYDVIDLQIGGANLLLGTKDFIIDSTRIKGWNNPTGYTITTDADGFAIATKEGVDFTTSAHRGIYSSVIKTMQGDKFTVSFWMKISDISLWDNQVPIILELYDTSLVRVAWHDCQFTILNTVPSTLQNDTWTYCTLSFEINNPFFNFAENKIWNDVAYFGIRLNLAKNGKIYFKKAKVEKGNKATDWTPAPEDLVNEASNVNVMLSNEAHFFEANASGIPTATSVVLDVFGYKGSIQSPTTVCAITGLPSAGMTATIASNNTTSTTITINVTSALTSAIADSGVLTIPITVNGHTINKKFSWSKSKEGAVGASGTDAVTFRIYSTEGYALSINTPSITLQTFAYVGDVAITAGATYQWYSYNNGEWTAITSGTNNYLSVARDDVNFSNGYMCKMMFGGVEYVDVVTIEDKSDNNQVFVSKPSNYSIGDIWIVSSDYIPPKMAGGVLLKAVNANKTYADADWITATAYDSRMQKLESDIATYNNYFDFDTAYGIKITAKDEEGNVSPFSTTLSHTRLSFNQGAEAVAYIESNKMKIKEAEIESPLSVTGKKVDGTVIQYPVINIGNFSLIVESNGSLSIIANT